MLEYKNELSYFANLKAFLLLWYNYRLFKIVISKWQFFCHLMWKTFCHFYRANSIKTNLLTCNLLTKWSVSYKSINLFWLNYFWHWMWKRFCYSNRANSNLKIDIFDIGCEKHSRRNAFLKASDDSAKVTNMTPKAVNA